MKCLQACLLAGVGLLAGACSADTEVDLARAEAYAIDGDFAPAWCIWNELAGAGNATAQYNLGWLYRNGQGVSVDNGRARQLWEQAARSGHADAQMALAMLLDQGGPGIEADPAQALHWYRAAAGQGIEDALLVLIDRADRGETAAVKAVAELTRSGQVGRMVSVTVDDANVRERPTTDAKVLATLPRGARVRQLVVSGDWYRVWVPKKEISGWMYHSLFE